MSATPNVRFGAYPQTPVSVRAARNALPPTPSPKPSKHGQQQQQQQPLSPPKRRLFFDPSQLSPVSSWGALGRGLGSGSSIGSSSSIRSAQPSHQSSTGPAGAGSGNNNGQPGGGAAGAAAGEEPSGPVISLDVIDAPTQRFYAVALYIGLMAWKGYDWVQLMDDNAESFWLFLKWVGLDFLFLFGLPELRVPWLELSQPFVIFLFLCHAVTDYLLMFNIGLPWHAWILGLFKVFYDRELSISERYVKASSILHNSSLISGRQIINILPEGSAVLNPDGLPFCVSGGGDGGSSSSSATTTASLPLYFNATIPAEVELVRIDLDTNEEETLRLKPNQLKDIAKLVKRQAQQAAADGASSAAVRYDVPVKKTGAYRLGHVLDEYKLDVQRPTPLTFVVACPGARVGNRPASSLAAKWSSSASSSTAPTTRCHGDLSDLLIEVDGTPPLKIVYSRTINGKDHSFHFQSLQPEGFTSPLLGTIPARSPPSSSSSSSSSLSSGSDTMDADSMVLANLPTEGGTDISWARSRHVTVGLNETMHVGGEWQYSIDEVHDAFGNVAIYNELLDDQHDIRPQPPKHLVQNFLVRERPRVRFAGCDLRQPLKVARGRSTRLPVRYELPGVRRPEDSMAHTLSWQFSPIDTLTKTGDHGDVVSTETFTARNADDVPSISAPGLYTLKSVSSNACEGEVQEPASCLLLNPLEPKLAVRAEGIPDSCGGNSIGLRVDLDLVGTPPFLVRYDVSSNGVVRHEKVTVPGMRYQLELVPRVAGNHKYIFRSIDDAVYKAQPLAGAEMALEQNVKPAARASIDHPSGKINACLQDTVSVDVTLSGEAPFTLEYVLLHEGKRRAFKQDHIETYRYRIETPALAQGGEYTLALTSVHDRSGCRTFLQGTGGELKIAVRRQRPRAAFGLVENKRRILAVEGASVRLPLRLTGEGPWTVSYENMGTDYDASRDSPIQGEREDQDKEQSQVVAAAAAAKRGELITRKLTSGNDFLDVSERGTYKIFGVIDNQCYGVVDPAASLFEVDWFPRPQLAVVQTDAVQRQHDNLFVKHDVCEGDIDGFEIDLRGAPPYHVEYDVRHKPAKGSQSSLIHKELDAALGRASIQMDTSRAGTYRYEFAPPADSLYNSHRPRAGNKGARSSQAASSPPPPLVLQQTVYAKPTAVFAKAGQSYKYCMTEQADEDRIPMVLTGVPPFAVEIEIKHPGSAAAETYRLSSIPTHTYDLQIPRTHLRPGTQQVRIRKVRDARGCQQKTDELVGLGSGTSGGDKQLVAAGAGGAGAGVGAGAGAAATVQVQLFEPPAIYALETRTDFCVGERLGYTLSGTPPFDVWYTFAGVARQARSTTTSFRRVAEAPGVFTITAVGDRASACRAAVNLTRTIHPLPSVRVSQGRTAQVAIHEGGAVPVVLEFGGTPPFEYTYTRSTNVRPGQRSQVLETRHDVSYEAVAVLQASQEGTYEVVAVKDRYCAFSTQRGAEGSGGGGGGDGKLK
ncbi:nuclear envelope pore membrane protein [Niveomyces insectorum RCEF 264]|uniref:Nuclear envelope pore membrane protein n=1 Tax=Niveomyces insectorum RCEF 264 TaxID=1081102 RepID=A0A167PRX7_9HYPO|nr:nuclear envelope pore membrane protein [Niveomyces insectorum RCEF 264]